MLLILWEFFTLVYALRGRQRYEAERARIARAPIGMIVSELIRQRDENVRRRCYIKLQHFPLIYLVFRV